MPEIIVQFIKFGIVGFSNTIISYAIYSVLVYVNVNYLVASIVAFVISVLNSFIWNNKYVFKKETNQKRNIVHSLVKTYISYAFTGLILQNVLLFIFIENMKVSKYLAPVFGLIITIPLNFIFNRLWAFRSVRSKKDELNEKNQCSGALL